MVQDGFPPAKECGTSLTVTRFSDILVMIIQADQESVTNFFCQQIITFG